MNRSLTESGQYKRLAIGFGCSSLAGSDEIVRLIKASIDPVPHDTLLATLDRREIMGEIVSSILGLRLALFPASTLASVRGTMTHSPLALARTGTSNVAEAAALASLGAAARLMVPQTRGRFCTCAIAALACEVQS